VRLTGLEDCVVIGLQLVERRSNALGFERLRMGRYIATAFLENGRYRGHALLQLTYIYLVQLRHHHVWQIPLNDSLEHFMLDHYFAKPPEFLVPFLDQSRFYHALLLLGGINHLLNPGADLGDGVDPRMGSRRNHPGIAAFKSDVVGWESVYAWNDETFGPDGMLGRKDSKDAILTRELRAALIRLNPDLPAKAIDDAFRKLTVYDVSRSLLQHNRDFYNLIRNGVSVDYRDPQGRQQSGRVRVIDFENKPGSNRFLAVRELKLTGIRTPNYNRRADLVCFVNGLPLVFVELKAGYKNIRAGYDGNLRDYMDENVIAHAFHHNAFLIVSNGDRGRYGSITSQWEHFATVQSMFCHTDPSFALKVELVLKGSNRKHPNTLPEMSEIAQLGQ
jgi:hypothetical protein